MLLSFVFSVLSHLLIDLKFCFVFYVVALELKGRKQLQKERIINTTSSSHRPAAVATSAPDWFHTGTTKIRLTLVFATETCPDPIPSSHLRIYLDPH